MKNNLYKYFLLIFVVIFLLPSKSFAHLASGKFGDFYAGAFHLLTAIEHLIPIIAFGLIAGQQGKEISRRLVVLLPFVLIIGCIVGIMFPVLTFSVYINSISFLIIGGLIALNKELSSTFIILLVVVFGLTHGYSNGTALEKSLSVFNYLMGVSVSGLVVVTIFSGIVLSVQKDWQKIAVRVAGSWIAAVGLITIPMLFK